MRVGWAIQEAETDMITLSIVPLFAVILLGYVLRKTEFLSPQTVGQQEAIYALGICSSFYIQRKYIP